MDYNKESLRLHREWGGKLETIPKMSVNTRDALSVAYTPGVAAACLAIKDDYAESFQLTQRKNTVAVVTDGTAVLGLGDIGAEAAMPVMEGKCALFKAFGNVDAVPICLRTKDADEIVRTIELIAGAFGGINLEDISAPRCFEIEEKLKARLDIPVFHDDQHGTAIVVLAALINALRLTDRTAESAKIVISGSGAAGTAVAKLLRAAGASRVTMTDKNGIVHPEEPWLNDAKRELALWTNPDRIRGSLADALKGADVFIGVSAPGILTPDMVSTMNPRSIVFAMANPVPEIMPDLAAAAGAEIIGTGRSDFPNQINNVLAFPGIFRGALDVRAERITETMKLAAARAIADIAEADRFHILPEAFDSRLAPTVAAAVKREWSKSIGGKITL
ncbi:MAG: NADP-dependent malic enzyme [Oscillospiraceae bacterium]|jgi:malate dehydrogenase (oxaloacetate-decarboxylating)|nr:NADP-dependent malic enzyme [Oscillospiraceae bacterium]